MEKRDTILLLLLAGTGGWFAYKHRHAIGEKLGIDDFRPGRLKAESLVKDATTFAPPTPNWVVLRDREREGEISLPKQPWLATEIANPRFRVTCTWTENGETQVHVFLVDTGNSSVSYQGLEPVSPSPR